MKYEKVWKKILSPDEQVKYEFSVGKKYRLTCAALGCLAGLVLLFTPSYFIGFLIIVISVFYFNYFLKWTNAFAFTNKRVIAYRGWLATDLISIDYDKITDIAVDQSIFGKITTSGSLVVNTASSSFPELKQEQKIQNIEDPYGTKKKLDEIRGALNSR